MKIGIYSNQKTVFECIAAMMREGETEKVTENDLEWIFQFIFASFSLKLIFSIQITASACHK